MKIYSAQLVQTALQLLRKAQLRNKKTFLDGF